MLTHPRVQIFHQQQDTTVTKTTTTATPTKNKLPHYLRPLKQRHQRSNSTTTTAATSMHRQHEHQQRQHHAAETPTTVHYAHAAPETRNKTQDTRNKKQETTNRSTTSTPQVHHKYTTSTPQVHHSSIPTFSCNPPLRHCRDSSLSARLHVSLRDEHILRESLILSIPQNFVQLVLFEMHSNNDSTAQPQRQHPRTYRSSNNTSSNNNKLVPTTTPTSHHTDD